LENELCLGLEIKVRWLPSVAGQSDDFSNGIRPEYASEENEKLDIYSHFVVVR